MGLISNLILTSKKSSIIQELQQAIMERNQSVDDVASDLMRSWEKGGAAQTERAFTEATPPLISVVVPLFNEQDNVAHLVERLANTLNSLGKSYEVLLIDDGSGDSTWTRIAKAAARHHPRFRGLRLARRFGHQAALLAGLSRARGQAVVSMDGDLQHPPELIPELGPVNTNASYQRLTRN